MRHRHKKWFAALLMAMSATSVDAQYNIVLRINDLRAPVTEGINSFSLDKSSFTPYEIVQVSWDVNGNPDKVSITGIGDVPSSGKRSAVLGDIREITLTADYRGRLKTRTIAINQSDVFRGFSLDKTKFSEYEPVTVKWDVANTPSWVNITKVGRVPATGEQVAVFGDVAGVTLTASFNGAEQSKTIPVEISQEISDFSLDSTDFSEYAPVNLSWKVSGKPEYVTISGVGTVAKTGNQSAVLGNVNGVTLTAMFDGVAQTKTISTNIAQDIDTFALSKTSFSEYEAVTVDWKASGNATNITIPGVGTSLAKTGSQSITPGNVTSLTMSAKYGGAVKTKTIATNITQDIDSFTLSKTAFDVSEPVTVKWSVSGNAANITIPNVGTNLAKSGTQSAVFGNVTSVTLSAKYGATTKTSTINTNPLDWFTFVKANANTIDGNITTWNKWTGNKIISFYHKNIGNAQLPKGPVGLGEIGGYYHDNTLTLTNLDHLIGVRKAYEFNMQLSGLTNLDGLRDMTTITYRGNFSNNKLTSIEGLRSLTNSGTSTLYLQNNLLTSLDGLENLKVSGGIYALSNPGLSDISALSGVTSTMPGGLYLDDRNYGVKISAGSSLCASLRANTIKLYLGGTGYTPNRAADIAKVCY